MLRGRIRPSQELLSKHGYDLVRTDISTGFLYYLFGNLHHLSKHVMGSEPEQSQNKPELIILYPVYCIGVQ